MRSFSRKFAIVSAAAAITIVIAHAASAQPDPRSKPAAPAPPMVVKGQTSALPKMVFFGGGDSERSIKVDPKINISLCVMQGNVKVNGWDRNEVRVFVSSGTTVGFRVQQKNQKTGDPVWIMVLPDSGEKNNFIPSGECVSGDEIEIDAPVNATLNLKGQEVSIVVDGIRRVGIKNAGGDISLRNISDGINATTYRGDLTVEQSSGAMNLENTSGNILAFDASPSEIGDIFRAKTTSGSISVQKIAHRQIEVNSISGTVAYNGDILNGGSYRFGTSNGSIKLWLPETSSCMLTASYGFGAFSSDIPYKLATENITPGPVKNIAATLGKGGDASLRLTTNNGSISIKKQQ